MEIRNSIIEQAGRKFDDPEDIDVLPEKVEKNIGYYNEKIAETDRQIEAERKRVSRRDELAAKLPQEEETFAGMQVKLAELERNISALTAKVVSDREQATELAAGLRFRNRGRRSGIRSGNFGAKGKSPVCETFPDGGVSNE